MRWRPMQLLLGHTKLESTARDSGIEVDDALEITELTESGRPIAVLAGCCVTGRYPYPEVDLGQCVFSS